MHSILYNESHETSVQYQSNVKLGQDFAKVRQNHNKCESNGVQDAPHRAGMGCYNDYKILNLCLERFGRRGIFPHDSDPRQTTRITDLLKREKLKTITHVP